MLNGMEGFAKTVTVTNYFSIEHLIIASQLTTADTVN